MGGSNAAGIGDGAGRASDDTDDPNPGDLYICGDAEVTAKAGSQMTDAKAPAIGGKYGEVPTENLSDEEHKVTGGRLTRLNADGTVMEGMGYDYTSTPKPQPDDDEDDDDEDEEDDDEDADDANDDDIASEPFYEVACPNCGETVYVSEDDLDAGEANCAHCGVTFEVALEGDEEEPDEDAPVQYEVTCPDCGTTAVFEEEELLEGEPKCPNCGKPLDFEVTEE